MANASIILYGNKYNISAGLKHKQSSLYSPCNLNLRLYSTKIIHASLLISEEKLVLILKHYNTTTLCVIFFMFQNKKRNLTIKFSLPCNYKM